MILLGLALSLSMIFAFAWIWAQKLKNYSIVDSLWAFCISFSGLVLALFEKGSLSKRIAVGGLATFWGIRLGWHLAKRIAKHHPQEDSRYQDLRKKWNATGFLLFFQIQATSVLLLVLPYFFIARSTEPWGFLGFLGLTMTLIGIGGEILSDRQMSKFKNTHPESSSLCRKGLWRYSRHPNYFFESVLWCGLYLLACDSQYGWTTFHAPLLITFLLLKVTGIPPSEASSLKRKGAAYREYQRTTSSFFPLPPKS